MDAREKELEDLVKQAYSIFENCAVESGVCCCGDDMKNHHVQLGDHSPVDQGSYLAVNWMEAAKKVVTP